MVMYEVHFTPTALDDLARLDKVMAQRALQRLHWLAEHFESLKPQPLKGPWRGVFKLRVGDYRILYTIQHDQRRIIVLFVRHRREIYKTRP